MTATQVRVLSAMVTADPDFRLQLLTQPQADAQQVLGIRLSDRECAEIRRQAGRIKAAGARTDAALEVATPRPMTLPIITFRGPSDVAASAASIARASREQGPGECAGAERQ